MAKYYGPIGFKETYEKEQGIWDEHVIERYYRGEVLNARFRNDTSSEQLNDELGMSHEVSIVADSFAMDHHNMISYVTMYGVKWKVTAIAINFPRLNLTIGGLYNGPEPDEDETPCA